MDDAIESQYSAPSEALLSSRMPEAITVVGLGVRHLAESASRAGMRVTAVDAFADVDTLAAALAIRAQDPTPEGLIRAALKQIKPGSAVLWSGGFDGRPDLLRDLRQCAHLFGNSPAVAEVVGDPWEFFALLEELKIPFPEIHLDLPDDSAGWLQKRGRSCGGAGVCAAGSRRHPAPVADCYFQRRLPGRASSVLFVANGGSARIIGYNRLFSESRGELPYAYAGAATWTGPDGATKELIEAYVQRLTHTLGLRGINGIDLILSGDTPLVLELNARPTATLELHEYRLPGGGVRAHLSACAGHLPAPLPSSPRVVRGYRVVYADHSLVVPPVTWPAWARDKPHRGTRISADTPLCTVHACGIHLADLERRLRVRAQGLIRLIGCGGAPAA